MDDRRKPQGHVATFRFYAELNDFLPAGKQKRDFDYCFQGSPGIKDAVEAIGVPHPEVDLIVVNGASVGFDYRLRHGDSVSVYPVFEALDISPIVRLRPQPLRLTRFVLDGHLGKLVRALRLLGFDSAYDRDASDPDIIELAGAENRIILTRDRELLKSNAVTHGYWIRHTDPREQVAEVVERFDLRAQLRPFTRCSVCNGTIAPTNTAEAQREAPERVREWCEEYYRCSACGKLYWKGTHFDRLSDFVDWVTGELT
jgi:uncharacterized protein with PIN domain